MTGALFPSPAPERSADGAWVKELSRSPRYAIFSTEPTPTYRYELSDVTDGRSRVDSPEMLFVLTNPSTASHLEDDPTSRKVCALARAAGMGRWTIANPFAYRATHPKALVSASDPIGPACDALLLAAAKRARVVVLGWGPPTKAGAAFGAVFRARTDAVCAMFAGAGIATYAYAFTKDGFPGHPLFLPVAGSALLPCPPRFP